MTLEWLFVSLTHEQYIHNHPRVKANSNATMGHGV